MALPELGPSRQKPNPSRDLPHSGEAHDLSRGFHLLRPRPLPW